MSNQSEVTRILNQIREEYEAATRGLSGPSQGTCQHTFITARMENMGKLHEELRTVAGDGAMALMRDTLDRKPPKKAQLHRQ